MDEFIESLSLIQELDKKLMVLLRDGKTLIGYLRCIDQFANLVLHRTIERIHVGNKYGDIPRGIFIIRGENVALCGVIDQEGEERITKDLEQVSMDEILEAQQKELEEKLEKKKLKHLALQKHGFFADYAEDI